MHELSFTKNILTVALQYAEKTEAERIKAIYLRIGILRDIEDEWLRRYFAYISKGTIAEAAELFVMVEPVVCKCCSCGEQFGIDIREIADDEVLCPKCSLHDYEMISGTEFIIQTIEVT